VASFRIDQNGGPPMPQTTLDWVYRGACLSADPAWSAPATFGQGRSDIPVRAAQRSGRLSRV
jgi:hypothetical protein